MHWNLPSAPKSSPNRFVPQVEGLEERTVPTVNFFITGTTLVVTASRGDFGSQQVTINDNGTGGINNITASTNGRRFQPNVALSTVIVDFGNAPDRIQYNLTADLSVSRELIVLAGGGDDRVEVFLRRNIRTGARLGIDLNGQAGNDIMNVTLVGRQHTGSTLLVNMNGGSGADRMTTKSAEFLTQENNAFFGTTMIGQSGNDLIQYSYVGAVDGTLSLFVSAGGGRDLVDVRNTIGGSNTGRFLPATVLGGGNDDVLVFVNQIAGLAVSIDHVLNGGGGFNTCRRSTDVFAIRCTRDTIV